MTKKPPLTWRQAIPTLITLAAMMCGFFSILMTLESLRNGVDVGRAHLWAAQLIMLAMILDGLDGNVARRLNGCSALGAELDTYVDMTAFGIAPALLIYVVNERGPLFWRVVMTAAVVLSGVVRLARFKATDIHRGQHGFSGLPITACAGWVASLVFLSETASPGHFLSLQRHPMQSVFLAGIVTFIVLQVSNIRYPKPTKVTALFLPMMVLVGLLFVPDARYSVPAASILVLLGVGYTLFGPFYMWHAARRLARRRLDLPPPITEGDAHDG